MREICSSIVIEAVASTVWNILTDFARYPVWNPFILKAEGTPREKARLRVRLRIPGGREMRFRPRVLRVVPERELRWRGSLYLPGIFDGEHIFVIEPLDDDRVRFVQREIFRGVLVRLPWRGLFRNTLRGFDAMNRALRERAEHMERYGPIPIPEGAHRFPGDGSGAEVMQR